MPRPGSDYFKWQDLPPVLVQSPASRNFPLIFRSSFSPPSPCSTEHSALQFCPQCWKWEEEEILDPCSWRVSAWSRVERCDVMWGWGGCGHHGALSGELWAQKVGRLVQPRCPGSGLKGKNILQRGHSESFAEAGKPLDWFYETGFPHHGRLQARGGCVTGRLCGGKAPWTAEAHLCDIHPSPGLTQERGDLHSQLYQGGALGIANSQDTMPFSLSFSFKWTVEFPRGEHGQTERRVDDEQIQVSAEMSFTKQI